MEYILYPVPGVHVHYYMYYNTVRRVARSLKVVGITRDGGIIVPCVTLNFQKFSRSLHLVWGLWVFF